MKEKLAKLKIQLTFSMLTIASLLSGCKGYSYISEDKQKSSISIEIQTNSDSKLEESTSSDLDTANEMLSNVSIDISTPEDIKEIGQKVSLKLKKIEKQEELNVLESIDLSNYDGSSIVDGLKSIGCPSDFEFRKSLAEYYQIVDYDGSLEKNLELLNVLRKNVVEDHLFFQEDNAIDVSSGVQESLNESFVEDVIEETKEVNQEESQKNQSATSSTIVSSRPSGGNSGSGFGPGTYHPNPGLPSETNPELPPETIPESPSETNPELPPETIPGSPSETNPELPPETIPGSPSETNPELPPETVPEFPSEHECVFEVIATSYETLADGTHYKILQEVCKDCEETRTTTMKENCDYHLNHVDNVNEYWECICGDVKEVNHKLDAGVLNENGTVTYSCETPGCDYTTTVCLHEFEEDDVPRKVSTAEVCNEVVKTCKKCGEVVVVQDTTHDHYELFDGAIACWDCDYVYYPDIVATKKESEEYFEEIDLNSVSLIDAVGSQKEDDVSLEEDEDFEIIDLDNFPLTDAVVPLKKDDVPLEEDEDFEIIDLDNFPLTDAVAPLKKEDVPLEEDEDFEIIDLDNFPLTDVVVPPKKDDVPLEEDEDFEIIDLNNFPLPPSDIVVPQEIDDTPIYSSLVGAQNNEFVVPTLGLKDSQDTSMQENQMISYPNVIPSPNFNDYAYFLGNDAVVGYPNFTDNVIYDYNPEWNVEEEVGKARVRVLEDETCE